MVSPCGVLMVNFSCFRKQFRKSMCVSNCCTFLLFVQSLEAGCLEVVTFFITGARSRHELHSGLLKQQHMLSLKCLLDELCLLELSLA